MTSETYTVQLTEEQKQLFDQWLFDTEQKLEAELERIKLLRMTVATPKKSILPAAAKNEVSKSHSLTAKTLNAFRSLGDGLTSVQIIAWLQENDPQLKHQSRRYITKAVTSKLSLLVDKGRIEKKVIDGKNVYSLKDVDLKLL